MSLRELRLSVLFVVGCLGLAHPASALPVSYSGTLSVQLAQAPVLSLPMYSTVDLDSGITSANFGAATGIVTASASGVGGLVFGPTNVTSAIRIDGKPFTVTGIYGPVVEITVDVCQLGTGTCDNHSLVYKGQYLVSQVPHTTRKTGPPATFTARVGGFVLGTTVVTGPRGTILTGVGTQQLSAGGLITRFNAVAPVMVTSPTTGFYGGAGMVTLSMSVVPEPDATVLVVCGLALALFAWRGRRFAPRQQS